MSNHSGSVKTEYQKMLAGERYNIFDPTLIELRSNAQTLFRRFNLLDSYRERHATLQLLIGHVGQDSVIEPPFFCSYGRHIYLGDHVFVNANCTILDNAEVHIGHHVMIGPSVQIFTPAHALEAEDRIQGWEVAQAIVIEDKVWIGGAAILLPGVRIGCQAVVGAGAVVTRSVPPFSVVAGNPARVIRELPHT
jgi:maltose O-acetyltransferase